jgi:hypothetical protein
MEAMALSKVTRLNQALPGIISAAKARMKGRLGKKAATRIFMAMTAAREAIRFS